jgi:hypothetical protein
LSTQSVRKFVMSVDVQEVVTGVAATYVDVVKLLGRLVTQLPASPLSEEEAASPPSRRVDPSPEVPPSCPESAPVLAPSAPPPSVGDEPLLLEPQPNGVRTSTEREPKRRTARGFMI